VLSWGRGFQETTPQTKHHLLLLCTPLYAASFQSDFLQRSHSPAASNILIIPCKPMRATFTGVFPAKAGMSRNTQADPSSQTQPSGLSVLLSLPPPQSVQRHQRASHCSFLGKKGQYIEKNACLLINIYVFFTQIPHAVLVEVTQPRILISFL